jgi:hypothetical protein
MILGFSPTGAEVQVSKFTLLRTPRQDFSAQRKFKSGIYFAFSGVTINALV